MNIPKWNEKIKELADTVRGRPIIRGSQTNRVAVIIEPRNHEVLYDLLTWTFYLLAPEGWKFIVYSGNLNIHDVLNFVNTSGVQDIVEVRTLGKDNLAVSEYSKMFTSTAFWQSIPYENILIFQTDSVWLDGKLDEFLHYDYVGSPWNERIMAMIGLTHSIGNGGLSLRRRSAMIRAITNYHKPGYPDLRKRGLNQEEDFFFCYHCKKSLNFPSKEVGMRFGSESIFSLSSKGFHKPWLYLPDQMEQIYEHIDRKRDSLLPLVEKPTVSKTN